jgi:hypothetical protein
VVDAALRRKLRHEFLDGGSARSLQAREVLAGMMRRPCER